VIDVDDIPDAPPRKRRQLEDVPDKWLAVWAADERLPVGDRKRVRDLRERRKRDRMVVQRSVGVLVTPAGVSPSQTERLIILLDRLKPTEIHHPYMSPVVHRACAATGAIVTVHRGEGGDMTTAQCVEVLVGLVKDTTMPDHKQGVPVWDALRRAKDRDVDVKVIWPDGTLLEGRW
jgi:hypothetical protein